MEAVIHRARQLLLYLSPQEAMLHIAEAETRETAFLAVKAAMVMDRPCR